MTRNILMIMAVTAFATLPAVGQTSDPGKFLEKASAKYLDLCADGLKSFSSRVTIASHNTPGMGAGGGKASFVYGWTSPQKETIDFDKTPKEWQKPVRKALGRMWGDITGKLFFDSFDKAGELTMSKGKGTYIVSGLLTEHGEFKARFEPRTYKMTRLELPKYGITYRYRYGRVGKKLRIDSRDMLKDDKVVMSTRYSSFSKVSGHQLPTKLTLTTTNDVVELTIDYQKVNGKAAEKQETEAKTVKDTVIQFEKDWRRASAEDKVTSMKTLSETKHDGASAAIAKWGLKDPLPQVRLMAASTLGKMKRKNVTLALTAALGEKRNQTKKLYQTICWAVAQLDDPRAIKPLTRSWWIHKDAGSDGLKGRLWALGRIRHPESVDKLLNILTVTDKDDIKPYGAVILDSLKNLTGQDFATQREWKNWWKKNRATFRF